MFAFTCSYKTIVCAQRYKLSLFVKSTVKPILGISGFINTTFNLHFPETSKSFGSFNQTMKNYLLDFSNSKGIWLDPIYNVKLFYTAQNLINQVNTSSEILVIHSGGTLSLQGFQEKLF